MAGRSHHDYLNDDNHGRSNNDNNSSSNINPRDIDDSARDNHNSCIVGRSHLYIDDGCDNIYNDH